LHDYRFKKKCGQRTRGDEIASNGSNFKTRETTVSREVAFSTSKRVSQKKA